MKHLAIAAFALVLCAATSQAQADETGYMENVPYGYDFRIVQLPSEVAEHPDEQVIIPIIDNRGGDINTFIENRLLMEHYEAKVEISGVCASSCTIYTGMKDACITDDAYFLFHQGTTPWVTSQVMKLTNQNLVHYVETYAVPLPPNGYSLDPDMSAQSFIYISGKEVLKNGWMANCVDG